MHTSSRRHALRLFVLGLAVAGFGLPAIARADDDGQLVFTSSNASAGNALMVYATASDGSVAGFRNARGELQAIAGSARGLSAAGGTAPAQVGFGSDGDVLVVTEKATNRLTSYPVLADGRLGAPVVSASAGATPFGFAF